MRLRIRESAHTFVEVPPSRQLIGPSRQRFIWSLRWRCMSRWMIPIARGWAGARIAPASFPVSLNQKPRPRSLLAQADAARTVRERDGGSASMSSAGGSTMHQAIQPVPPGNGACCARSKLPQKPQHRQRSLQAFLARRPVGVILQPLRGDTGLAQRLVQALDRNRAAGERGAGLRFALQMFQ